MRRLVFALTCVGASSGGRCADDADEGCIAWAAAGECEANPGYMLQQCAASCRGGECAIGDAATDGERRSAGLGTSPRSQAPLWMNGCVDLDIGCGSWARAGECAANPAWMRANCASSCEACKRDAKDSAVLPRTPAPLANKRGKRHRCCSGPRLFSIPVRRQAGDRDACQRLTDERGEPSLRAGDLAETSQLREGPRPAPPKSAVSMMREGGLCSRPKWRALSRSPFLAVSDASTRARSRRASWRRQRSASNHSIDLGFSLVFEIG